MAKKKTSAKGRAQANIRRSTKEAAQKAAKVKDPMLVRKKAAPVSEVPEGGGGRDEVSETEAMGTGFLDAELGVITDEDGGGVEFSDEEQGLGGLSEGEGSDGLLGNDELADTFDGIEMTEGVTKEEAAEERFGGVELEGGGFEDESFDERDEASLRALEEELRGMSTEELKEIVRRRELEEGKDEEMTAAKAKVQKKTATKATATGKGTRKIEKPKKKRRVLKTILTLFLVALIAGVGYVAWYVLTALDKTSNVFQGSALDILVAERLKEDENGLTNVLIFGTSEDEGEHEGALLADSILVISVDQDTKRAKEFSIPRDLYVNYTVEDSKVLDVSALKCSVGYKGKINAEYMCALEALNVGAGNSGSFGSISGSAGNIGSVNAGGAEESANKGKAAQYFVEKVEEVTGLEIQYYVAVDWMVLKTVVDTLGGIDVDVWATDERGISDICQQLQVPKGMNYGVDGETALKIARARGACYASFGSVRVNYGLSNSNFDREKNQQRIINAIKNKALDVGVLADPGKVFGMIDALGENMRTNISMGEVRTVLEIAMNLDGVIGQIETQDLYQAGMYNSASIVVPVTANLEDEKTFYNYKGIKRYLVGQLKDLYEDPVPSD